MSSYSFATTLTRDGQKIDAYAVDIAHAFQQIMNANEPHLQGIKEPLTKALTQYKLLKNNTEVDMLGVATLLRTLNQKDWESNVSWRQTILQQHKGALPYPDTDVIETLPLALAHATGFDTQSFEGLIHFHDALERTQYNIDSKSLWAAENSLFSELISAVGAASTEKHPTLLKRSEPPTPAEVAHSITKLLAGGNNLYFKSGLNLWEMFDTFDLDMNFSEAPGNKYFSVSGEDRLMYLYQNAFYGATELVVPLSGNFNSLPFAPHSFMPVNQYYAHNYKTSHDIPRPDLHDLENLQIALEQSVRHMSAPDTVLYDPEGNKIAPGSRFLTAMTTAINDFKSFRDVHLRAVHENLNTVKLNPMQPYQAAMEAFKVDNTPNVPVFAVSNEPFNGDIADSLKDFHRSGGLVFTNEADANSYIAHLQSKKRQSPVKENLLCSPAQLRGVTPVTLWQIEAIRNALSNIDTDTMAIMSAQQRLAVVRGVAADQGLHLPEVFLKAAQLELSTYAHMDNWTNQLLSAVNRVPKQDVITMVTEFAQNAPTPQEESPRVEGEPFNGYSRPRLSP